MNTHIVKYRKPEKGRKQCTENSLQENKQILNKHLLDITQF